MSGWSNSPPGFPASLARKSFGGLLHRGADGQGAQKFDALLLLAHLLGAGAHVLVPVTRTKLSRTSS